MGTHGQAGYPFPAAARRPSSFSAGTLLYTSAALEDDKEKQTMTLSICRRDEGDRTYLPNSLIFCFALVKVYP